MQLLDLRFFGPILVQLNPHCSAAMATVILYIVIKVYWDSQTILSSYHELNINIPGTPPGWFRDQTAYVIFNFSSNGRVSVSHEPPQDGHHGLEHFDEYNHTSSLSVASPQTIYPGQHPGNIP